MARTIYTDYTLGKVIKAKAALARETVVGGPTGEPTSYAGYLEYGTSRTPPRPFLRPAVEDLRPFMGKLAAACVNRAVKTGTLSTAAMQDALVEAIRANIRAQGLVKTGALLASIRATGG